MVREIGTRIWGERPTGRILAGKGSEKVAYVGRKGSNEPEKPASRSFGGLNADSMEQMVKEHVVVYWGHLKQYSGLSAKGTIENRKQGGIQQPHFRSVGKDDLDKYKIRRMLSYLINRYAGQEEYNDMPSSMHICMPSVVLLVALS